MVQSTQLDLASVDRNRLGHIVLIGGRRWYNTISSLPEEIELNRQSIAEIQSRVGNVEKGQDAILSAIRLSNCLALAQAKDEPYQECMK